MKTDTRHYLGWNARLRLLGRVLGITALFAALGGLFLYGSIFHEITVDGLKHALAESNGAAQFASLLIVAGGSVAIVALVIELVGRVGGSGQRSATGINATVQILLALGVFAALNYFSFYYFKRWDLTRDHEFTLPQDVTEKL